MGHLRGVWGVDYSEGVHVLEECPYRLATDRARFLGYCSYRESTGRLRAHFMVSLISDGRIVTMNIKNCPGFHSHKS